MKTLLLAAACTVALAGCGESIQDEMAHYIATTVTYEQFCGAIPEPWTMERVMPQFVKRVGDRKKMNMLLAADDLVDSVFIGKAQEQRMAQIGKAEWCRDQRAQWQTQFGS